MNTDYQDYKEIIMMLTCKNIFFNYSQGANKLIRQ